MSASFQNFKIQWKLISTVSEANRITYEYECKLPGKCSDRKYHMQKVIAPHRLSIFCNII